MHEILQKRWFIFFLMVSVVYSYHFISIITGMNQFVHYTRFIGCGTAVGEGKFKEASALFDTPLFIVLVFHIIEWVRQTILITVILVGVKWIPAYFILTINLPFGIIACLYGAISGLTAAADCKTAQPGRVAFLSLQILTFFLYLFWFFLPAVVFKINDKLFKPDEKDENGELLYETWTQ